MSKTLVLDALNVQENTIQAKRDEIQSDRDNAAENIIRFDLELAALDAEIIDVQTATTTAERDIP